MWQVPNQVLPTRLFCFPNIKGSNRWAGNYRDRIISSASTPSVIGRTDHWSRQADSAHVIRARPSFQKGHFPLGANSLSLSCLCPFGYVSPGFWTPFVLQLQPLRSNARRVCLLASLDDRGRHCPLTCGCQVLSTRLQVQGQRVMPISCPAAFSSAWVTKM